MKYRILHVEDLKSDADLAEREISKVLNNYSLIVVETESDFITSLGKFNPHLVISDFMLPSFDGMRALKIVLEKSPDTPVIMLTGSMNEDTAVDCIKSGAADYVIKEHIKRLGAAILNALQQKEIKIEKKKALDHIKLLSKSIAKSAVGIVITDSSGNLEYVNPKFTEITGYTENEVYGKKYALN
jgi:DNA-binding NtrC family response regulator